MASPPYGGITSPPAGSPLALPGQRQRPTLALPTGIKSRKPSVASAISSAHPLRQTSFPPPDSLEAQHALAEDNMLAQYSPSATGSMDDFSDDLDVESAISIPATDGGLASSATKRKRGAEKGKRGRPPKYRGVNGDDGRLQRRAFTGGAPSIVTAEDAGEVDEEDDFEEGTTGGPGGGRLPLYEGGQMTPAEQEAERKRKAAFYESVSEEHKHRFNTFGRAKLKTADVRKLVNQTLSQSVPQNVVLVVSAYAKMWAGMMIEDARQVQREWEAVADKRADGEPNRAWRRLQKTADEKENAGETGEVRSANAEGAQPVALVNGSEAVANEPTSPDNRSTVNGTKHENPKDHSKKDLKGSNGDSVEALLVPLGGAGGLEAEIEECDLGPLLPDHLREALRRYRKRHAGGSVGFTGLSLEGRENTAPRMGGRRLFR
ncbi:hypothetical protein BAUCODRAFT_36305 [Baudoinia panamericana UAMH 10762]|uniref:TAFII28-like protein domain-containing protein n=1 Tax=Baudoinia panamericana (strain UAMH 10762) TaxID=717646 RepID=M2N506_BAUPA|nr:uncharacterized protein BAUCODRAFT_36305 [Baudoinia panamericana UAMH 10762]EMC93845.1 hypothetical protein BAUCODRAFT_36305 [Baudoinia panamericana UAMH 10762]